MRESAEIVTEFDDKLHNFVNDMLETLYNDPKGVGLAAPQVGVSKRVAVIDISMEEEESSPVILINPEILESEGENSLEEGCLSIPDIYETVVRAEKVRVRFQDINGNEQEMEAKDFFARVIQHETDHLNGILFVDRLSTVKKGLLAKTLRTLAKEDDKA